MDDGKEDFKKEEEELKYEQIEFNLVESIYQHPDEDEKDDFQKEENELKQEQIEINLVESI